MRGSINSIRFARLGWAIAAAALLVICIATLTPSTPGIIRGANALTRARWTADALLADFLRNIVLFVPLGLGLRLAGVRTRQAILAGALVSLGVELLQATVVHGRDASVLDWLSNSLGTVVGAMLGTYGAALLAPPPRRAAWLSVAWLACWLASLLLGAWGLRPAPTFARYWGERTPRIGSYADYRGELSSVRLNDVEVPSAPLLNDASVRQSLRAGRVRIAAVVRPGPEPYSGLAPIVRVADEASREILVLAESRRGLVLKVRLRASTAGLETPGVVLPGAFPVHTAEGDGFAAAESVFAQLEDGRVRLAALGQFGTRRTEVALRPSFVWSFVVPWEYNLGSAAGFLGAVWLAALLLPVGYYGAAVERRSYRLGLLALTVVALAFGVEVVPLLFSLPRASPAEWLAAIAGLALGYASGRRRAQNARRVLVG